MKYRWILSLYLLAFFGFGLSFYKCVEVGILQDKLAVAVKENTDIYYAIDTLRFVCAGRQGPTHQEDVVSTPHSNVPLDDDGSHKEF